MTRSPLRIQVTKEARALIVPWALGVVASIAGLAYHMGGMLEYFGCLALCSMSFGHDSASRTLPMLLTQPVSRQRLLFTKLAALVPLLAALFTLVVLAAHLIPDNHFQLLNDTGSRVGYGLTVAVVSICLAPTLTLVSRSALAGAVFSFGLYGVIAAVGTSIASFVAPTHVDDMLDLSPMTDQIPWIYWGLTSPVFAACAWLGWRRFMTLEVVEGERTVELPEWLRARTGIPMWSRGSVPVSPLAALVRKELGLQQPAMIAAAAFVGLEILLRIIEVTVRTMLAPRLAAMDRNWESAFPFFFAVLSGALAGADERRLSTLSTQLMLPVGMWRQWWVKVLTVAALTLVIGVGLPYVCSGFRWSLERVFVAVVPLSVAALFVSTWFRSVLQSMMTVAALMALSPMAITGWGWRLSTLASRALAALVPHLDQSGALFQLTREFAWFIAAHTYVCFLAMVLPVVVMLGRSNYRDEDRSRRRLARQVCAVVASMLLAASLIGGVESIGFRAIGGRAAYSSAPR